MSTFLKGLLHTVIVALIFAGAFLLKIHPAWLDLTVGGLISTVYTWLIQTQTTVGFAHK
jgi:hypothetical protein